MATRLPNTRYLGDGCYASHDGYQLILETCDGLRVSNRIGLDGTSLDALKRYREYVNGFYETGQHQVAPGCEECGKDLTDPQGPLRGPVRGEIYQVSLDEVSHEVRLCQDCSKTANQPLMESIVRKRAEMASPKG